MACFLVSSLDTYLKAQPNFSVTNYSILFLIEVLPDPVTPKGITTKTTFLSLFKVFSA